VTKLKSKIAFGLVALLVLSMLSTLQVYAVSTPEIYLIPSAVLKDQEWNVQVCIRDVPVASVVFAYQVKLFFNTTFLECLEARIPEADKSWIFSGSNTVLPQPVINTAKGYAVVGASLLRGSSVKGSGLFMLASFDFCLKAELKDAPASYINVDNPDTFLVNNDLKKAQATINSEVSVNCVPDMSTTSLQETTDSDQIDFNTSYEESGLWDLVNQEKKLQDLAKRGESPVELIVGLNSQVSNAYAQVENVAAKYKSRIKDVVACADKVVAVVVNITSDQAESFMFEVEAKGISTYIESNHQFKVLWTPNDPYWGNQWGSKKIQADWAWNTTVGNNSLLIAVIDSGIDYTHPDLAPNYVPLGYNWVDNNNNCMDDFGHGTHVAGIIAAKLNNSIGIAGTAQVRIMAEKIYNSSQSSTDAGFANATYHAMNRGAKIISMSIGDYFYSQTRYKAIKDAYNNGTLLVAAAGNDAISCTTYPAYFDEVVAVTATDQNDKPASDSNFGKWVEVAAPGVDIYSTIPNSTYAYKSGTSMATPFVSGVAGLIWSRFPTLTRDQVRIHLRKTADDLGTSGFDIYYGYGRVNASRAVNNSLPQHDLVILNWNRTAYVTGGRVIVNATITNYGMSSENYVVVQLFLNGTLRASTAVSLASGQSKNVGLYPTASGTGVYNVTLYVVPASGETDKTDNTVMGYVGTEQKMIKVPDYYPTIQQAVDVAVSGDTVKVAPGTYNEAVHVYRSNISLIGQSRQTTIINGSGANYGIWVVYTDNADKTTISGFTLKNSGKTKAGGFCAGVYFNNSSYCIVSNNIISNNKEGIYMDNSYNNTIIGNAIVSNSDVGIASVFSSDGNFISNNTMEYNIQGIGVFRTIGKGDTISDNVVRKNKYGVLVSTNSSVTRNKFVENNDTAIIIFFFGGTGVTIRDNHLRGNVRGIDLGGVSGNSIYHNNFINNTNQVVGTSANKWYGRWNVTGDYWSNYMGSDPDGDGIGNTPYIINANNSDNFPFMNPYLPGDVNHDGEVDILDISFIAAYYGSTVTVNSPVQVKRADLNGDAIVDTLDINIAAANFDKTWQSYWGE